MFWRVTGGANFSVPIPGGSKATEADAATGIEDDLARTIVDCEVNSSEWTLMHRYNKASDLIEGILAASTRPHLLLAQPCLLRLCKSAWTAWMGFGIALHAVAVHFAK